VLEAQAGGSDDRTLNNMNKHSPVRLEDGPKTELRKETQVPVVGEENFAATGEGKVVDAPVCRCLLSVSSLFPKTLPYPTKSSLEALRGHMESEGDRFASLGVRLEL
jgi:hypothetical protein